ncbi:MAG TPA: hypothetical protein DCL44_08310 [Elusimicrobia bacterium]|nr:hypothetical protein [Elusimicrobiota bacterium]
MKPKLIAFSALLSFAAVASAEDRAPQLPPIDAGTIWSQINNNQHPFPQPAPTTKSAGTDSMVVRGVIMSRIASNTLTTIALSLKGLEQQHNPNAAPAEYTRGVDETAALIEESVYNLETLLKARDGVGLHTEVAHMTPLVKKLGALAASIEGSSNYGYWAGKDVKKIGEDLNIYLLTIRTNAMFL